MSISVKYRQVMNCEYNCPVFHRIVGKIPYPSKTSKTPLIEESERLVKALEKSGNQQVKFTIYPEAGHDSWTAAYDMPELWDWLFAQQRKP